MLETYTIVKAMPHDGTMKEIHQKVIDTKCHIFLLSPGMSAILYFQLKDNPDEWHHLQTSAVHTVDQSICGVIKFSTNNTDYTLVSCER